MLGRTLLLGSMLSAAMLAACSDYDSDGSAPPAELGRTSIQASGSILAKVDEFRSLLGDRNGGNVGPQPAGRREIGWDGVPANFNNADNAFPADFFNTNSKLGAVFTTNGTGFRNDSTLFIDLQETNGGEFSVFSPNKIFASSGGNVIDVWMQVPGQPTPGLSTGFGAVFVDVDNAGVIEAGILPEGRHQPRRVPGADAERCERALLRGGALRFRRRGPGAHHPGRGDPVGRSP